MWISCAEGYLPLYRLDNYILHRLMNIGIKNCNSAIDN